MKRRTLLKTGLAGGMLLAFGTASLPIGRDPADDRDTVLRVVVPAMRDDGSPVLDYPLDAFVLDGARRAFAAMAEIQFAAGARTVTVGHERATARTTLAGLRAELASLPFVPLETRVASAHVMGGCGLSGDERLGLVRPDGRHRHLDNLSVHDGSPFPTSIGANPQLSIYGIVARLSAGLVRRLSGRDAGPLA